MKNVALFIPSLKPGGAEKQATLLATILDKHYGVDLLLLYGEDQASPQNLRLLADSGVRVHALSGNIVAKMAQMRAILKRNKTEVLLNYLTSCDVIGACVGRLAGVKRIYGGIRNTRVEWGKMVSECMAHNCVATGTIYNCYSGATYFATKGFRESKNFVIPNCFQDIASPIARRDRAVKHIVTVGRFVPQKDYQTIIRTISHLKQKRNDFVMDIVGYGVEEDNIRKWIVDYGVQDCVKIYIRPDNVQEIVRNADIYLSTSLYEGTSNSIMEAMNWSLPIVATNVGDNDHLVLDQESGTLHPIGDAVGMAYSIAELLDSLELRNTYGARSNQNLRDNYSMEIFEQRYTKLIEQNQMP